MVSSIVSLLHSEELAELYAFESDFVAKPGGSIDFVTLADGRKIGGGDGIPGAVVVGGAK